MKPERSNVPIRDAERPVCPCHGEPMLWQRDLRLTAGGRWECKERRRVYNQQAAERKQAWMRADYARSPRNYLWHRRRQLAVAREQAQAKLDQLRREAEDLVAQ